MEGTQGDKFEESARAGWATRLFNQNGVQPYRETQCDSIDGERYCALCHVTFVAPIWVSGQRWQNGGVELFYRFAACS